MAYEDTAHIDCEKHLRELISSGVTIDRKTRKEICEIYGVSHTWARVVVYWILDPKRNQKNYSRIQVSAQNSRARRLGAYGEIIYTEWKELCDRYGNVCLCCHQNVKLVIDHVLPLCLGGTNTIDNIQPLCATCNSKKGKRHKDYR